MNDGDNWDKFTNLYSLQKTLRFELKPIGETLYHINEKDLIEEDERRAESFKQMKNTIDSFHKDFIQKAMSQVKLSKPKLEKFAELYNTPKERNKEDDSKKFKEIQKYLREEIVKGFNTGEAKDIFPKMFKKELFTELLENWIPQEKMVSDLGEWNKKTKDEKKNLFFFGTDFKKFTTYFSGFNKNRENIYTSDEKSTAIAYRLIHENLPKFLDNIKTFEKIRDIQELYKECTTLYKELNPYISVFNRIDKFFELDYYNKLLTQDRIDIYNTIIGGMTTQDGKNKIKGLNEYVNLYNQKHDKKDKIPLFKPLYKQILSDNNSVSFLPQTFEDDSEGTASQKVLDAIKEYYRKELGSSKPDDKEGTGDVLKKIENLLESLKSYDMSKVYISNKAITNISTELFNDWSVITAALEFQFLKPYRNGKKRLSKKQETEGKKYIKQPYFSIEEIENALSTYKNEAEVLSNLQEKEIADKLIGHFLSKKEEESGKKVDLFANIQEKYSCIKDILDSPYKENKPLNQRKDIISNIKAFLDSLMELLHFVKPLSLPSDSTLEKDEVFYSEFQPAFDKLQQLTPLYNKVRDYASKKPYSIKKFKLNFKSSTLASGWDLNKEDETNYSVILKKDDCFMLGIINVDNKDILKQEKHPEIFVNESPLKKMIYKCLGDAKRQINHIAFSGKANPSEHIKKIKEEFDEFNKKKKNDKNLWKNQFDENKLSELIEYYKKVLEEHPEKYKTEYELKYKPNYKNLGEFFDDVTSQTYKLKFVSIDENYINELVKDGKLYLFQIYNKDFSKYSKGKPNIHTMYWRALFDPENLNDVVYKLNGGAELFYRRKSIKSPKTHKKDNPIENKNPNNQKKESVFKYELVKDKRYTVDKFQFHVPITLNFKAKETRNMNYDVLKFLKDNPDINIIGLDRGERNLIYLVLIDQKGNILEQRSLNNFTDNKFNIKTDYHKLLDDKEKNRKAARKDWKTIETIKELKEGYMGVVVHEISKMMVERNAILVMEDLNFGFKRGRFKVEKQVYQKLEKKLIDKLNYLVFKDKEKKETGGLYKALQLTNKFKSFKDNYKQNGFLFYVSAPYTSEIDPTTGFVSLFNTRYENLEKSKEFFDKFENISYNVDKDYFEFKVKKYSSFNPKAQDAKEKWLICTYGSRIKTFRNPNKNNQWDNEEIMLSDKFKELFEQYNIEYKNDLKKQILSQNEKNFFEELLNLFKYTVQMRNSITGSEEDYIISPVMNDEGKFYNSREVEEGGNLPKDADANGAYNIAKKGLWILKQINANKDWKKLKLAISNKEWFQFAQAEEKATNGAKHNNIKSQ